MFNIIIEVLKKAVAKVKTSFYSAGKGCFVYFKILSES